MHDASVRRALFRFTLCWKVDTELYNGSMRKVISKRKFLFNHSLTLA